MNPADATSGVSTTLSGARAPRQARDVVTSVLVRERAEGLLADALLGISELVTNAIAVAGSCTLDVVFSSAAGLLRIQVTDTAGGTPRVLAADPTRIGGHGLRIVESISSRWGVIVGEGSKTVWFELRAG